MDCEFAVGLLEGIQEMEITGSIAV